MDNYIAINEDSESLFEKMGNALVQISQEELEDVAVMNREQKRAWLRAQRRKPNKKRRKR